MLRKLLIIGAIASLFTIVTVVPASAIAIDKGGPNGGWVTVNDPAAGPQGGPNNAHGPSCGTLGPDANLGCLNHDGTEQSNLNSKNNPGLNIGENFGAWNSVFQAMENSNGNTAICGIWAYEAEAAVVGEDGLGFSCELPNP